MYGLAVGIVEWDEIVDWTDRATRNFQVVISSGAPLCVVV